MKDETFKLRLERGELEQWTARAEAEGLKVSEWIRRQCSTQSESEKGNGSADHQNVQRVPERKVSGRRATAARRTRIRVPQVSNVGNNSALAKVASEQDAPSKQVTKANFAEEMSLVLREEVDVWARSLPRSVLPGHDATSHRLTCMCSTCLEWRRVNAIPYGGAPKKESRWAK